MYALCEQFDITFLQETLLFRYELPLLCNIYPDFEGMDISAIDDTGSILAGRPYGGVAILIRKRLRPVCEFQFYDDTRMMLLEVTHSKKSCVLLMCLYLINFPTIMISMSNI